MVHEFQPRPLPTFDEYADAAKSVQQKMDADSLDARNYLSAIALRNESGKSFARDAARMANAVELIDPDTGQYADVERRRGRALFLGALAGYSLLYEIYNVSLPSSEMLTFVPPLTFHIESGDAVHNINSFHAALLTAGSEGRRYLGEPTNNHIAMWSEQAVTRPEYRPTFLAGTGLITLAGVEMQEQRIELFQQNLIKEHVDSNSEFDWDAALVDLKETGE